MIASPLIETNLFQDNHASNGGGIAIDGGTPEVRGNIFRGNTCDHDGGGVFAWMFQGSVIVEDNQFWENNAPDHGGAIYADNTNVADFAVIRRNLFVRNEAHGIGAEFTGSGGAIWINEFAGEITNNTIVQNVATGESGCDGSGIFFDRTPPNLEFKYNIIALGYECGIECLNLFGPVQNIPGPNILWHNMGGDIYYGPNHCPSDWAQYMIITDPLFCDPASDNYSVSIDSPALSGAERFGVWTDPGCGPGVTTRPITWGSLKARYR